MDSEIETTELSEGKTAEARYLAILVWLEGCLSCPKCVSEATFTSLLSFKE